MNIENSKEMYLKEFYRKGTENMMSFLIHSFMFMGDQLEIDCEFDVIGDRLIDSDNPKYQKYITDEFDRDDQSMIFKILVNETKYSESFMVNISKLIEFKKDLIKYSDQEKDESNIETIVYFNDDSEFKVILDKYGIDNDCGFINSGVLGIYDYKSDLIEKIFQFFNFDEFEDYESKLMEVV